MELRLIKSEFLVEELKLIFIPYQLRLCNKFRLLWRKSLMLLLPHRDEECSEVRKWLANLGLEKYFSNFKDAGFENLKLCSGLDEESLQAMKITTLGHKKGLLEAARNLKNSLTSGASSLNVNLMRQTVFANRIDDATIIDKILVNSKWSRRNIRPFRPLDVVRFSDMIIDRKDALKQAIDSFQLREKLNKENDVNGNSSLKVHNPMSLTFASPGIGKTTFLNLLACHVVESQIPLVPLLITFNSELNWEYDHRFEQGAYLAIRMLYQYYFGGATSWSNFKDSNEVYELLEWMTLSLAIKTILVAIQRDYLGKGLLLLVDEIRKSPHEINMITILGMALDEFPPSLFSLFITSLEPNPALTFSTNSGRALSWTKIVPLQHSLLLFDRYFPKPSKRSDAMEMVILDCNGHARSLEYVHEFFQTTVHPELMSYMELKRRICKKYGGLLGVQLNEDLICRALMGRQCAFNFMIAGRSFSDWIVTGALINGTGDFQLSIPIVSRLFMQCYALKNKDSRLSSYLLDLLSINNLTWIEFEKHHLAWECLIRKVYSIMNMQIGLAELYGLGGQNNLDLISKFTPIAKSPILVSDFLFLDKDKGAVTIDGQASRSLTFNDALLHIFEMRPGAQAIEGFSVEKSVNGHYFVVGYQCKRSDKNSSTILSYDKIYGSYVDFVKAVTTCDYLSSFQIDPKMIFYIVACDCQLPKTVFEEYIKLFAKFPQVIILNRSQLAKTYSPSLYVEPYDMT